MAETIVTIPAAELDRLVYVAIAEARNDAETELLAGLADRILQRRPNVAPANLTAAIDELRDAIATTRPARAAELAQQHLVADEPDADPQRARGSPRPCRAAAPATTPGRSSAATGPGSPCGVRSHRWTWSSTGSARSSGSGGRPGSALYDRAKARPAIAAVIDEGPIGQALGVQTTQRAVAMLDATELEPLRQFVLDRIQRNGAHHGGPGGPGRGARLDRHRR